MKNNYQIKISTNNLRNFHQINHLLTQTSTNLIIIFLPKKLKHFVFLKSPHINKVSKEHFQILTYNRLFFVNLSTNNLKIFLLKMSNSLSFKIKKIFRVKF